LRSEEPGSTTNRGKRCSDGRLALADLRRTSTLVYFVNDQFERGENFAEWGPAVEQAERVKRQMIDDGWREEAP
jgi:hypothetical protein